MNRRAFGGVLKLFNSGVTTSKCWLRTWDSERYDEEGEQWVVTPCGHWYSLKSNTDTTMKATITFTGGDRLTGRPVCSRCPIFQQEGRPCPEMKAVARFMGRVHGVVEERLTAARLLAWTSPAYQVHALKRELDALPAFTPVLWSDIDAVDGEVLFPAEAPARRQNSSASRPSRYASSGRIKSGGEDEQREAQLHAAAAAADEQREAERRAAAAAAQAKAAAKSAAKGAEAAREETATIAARRAADSEVAGLAEQVPRTQRRCTKCRRPGHKRNSPACPLAIAPPTNELVPNAPPTNELFPNALPTNELVPNAPPKNELVPNAPPMNELMTDEVTDEDALSALQSFAGDRETAAPPQPTRAPPKAKRVKTTTTPSTMPTHRRPFAADDEDE